MCPFFPAGYKQVIGIHTFVLYEIIQLDVHMKYLLMYYHGKNQHGHQMCKFVSPYIAEKAPCDNNYNSGYQNKIRRQSKYNSYVRKNKWKIIGIILLQYLSW